MGKGYSVSLVTEKLKKYGVKVDTENFVVSVPLSAYDEGSKNKLGLQGLGMIDYLIKYHNYKVERV